MLVEFKDYSDITIKFNLKSNQDIYNKYNKVYTINIITKNSIYQYVGQTKQQLRKRVSQHLHRNHIVEQTINEHRNDIIEINISYVRTYKDKEQLNKREKQEIRKSNKKDIQNINIIKYISK